MTKGGARIASDFFAVGKGMGLGRHLEVLCLVKQKKKISIKEAVVDLNKRFAWWDDPDAHGPTETCRSYFKEMWRLGFLERINCDSNVLENLGKETWSQGGKSCYRLSELGEFVISKDRKLFSYFVGCTILQAKKSGIYPQCDKLFQLHQKEGYIPVSDSKHVELTKKHKITVEKHGGKAIKFGWLEPTGIIYRETKDRFRLNHDYIDFLEKIDIKKLYEKINEKIGKEIEITLEEENMGLTSFDENSKYCFNIKFKNKSKKKFTISLESNLSGIFTKIAELKHEEILELEPGDEKLIPFTLLSKAKKLSDSFMSTFIGTLKIGIDSQNFEIFLPQIEIANGDRLWELKLCQMFRQLELEVFHVSGKSDRPDAVIDLSGLTSKPSDLLAYFRDATKEKILMETTINEYYSSKLKVDTIEEKRNMNKFERHTQLVLKIVAVGQIIVADYFASSISSTFSEVQSKVNHKVSLIDKESLEYLISKYNTDKDHSKIVKILKSKKIIDKQYIDTIF
ncbi:MAG: hypothetical protein EXR16_05125 [Bacteroidetes bacterium]|nr:hypothetical protein [Bacteroidota bacterium]